jgi:hypothetical protein
MIKSGFLEISLESSWIGRQSCLETEKLDGELRIGGKCSYLYTGYFKPGVNAFRG